MNASQREKLGPVGRVVWGLSAMLQEATNKLLFRRFTVTVGIIKGGSPAVVLEQKTVFNHKAMAMDLKSFLTMVKHIAEDMETDYTDKGFNVNEYFKDKMKVPDEAFTIPAWAFPAVEYRMFNQAQGLIDTMKVMDESMRKVEDMMREAGISEADIAKMRASVINNKGSGSNNPPTLH